MGCGAEVEAGRLGRRLLQPPRHETMAAWTAVGMTETERSRGILERFNMI